MFKSKFLQNNAIVMIGTLLGAPLGYAFHFVVSRQISVAQYGELQSLLSLSIIFGVFNSALGYFAIRHTSVFSANNDWQANNDFIGYLQTKTIKFASLVLIILLAASPLLAKILHFSSYTGFFVLSLATYISTLTVAYGEVLRGWGNFLTLTIIALAVGVIKILSGSALAIGFHTTAAVSVSFLVMSIANLYFAKVWTKKMVAGKPGLQKSESIWKNKYFPEANIRRTATKIFFFSLAIVLLSNIDVILVKYFASADIAGFFGAFNMLGKIVLFLNMAVIGVMLPEACVDGHSGRRLNKKNLLRTYGLMTLIGFGSMTFFYLFPNFVVRLFFGQKYIFETQLLWLFALISYLLSVLTLEANLSFAKRDFRVVYFLIAAILLMVGALAKFRGDLREIILALIGTLLAGYLAVVSLNIINEKRSKFDKN
ncbi:MAG TPA: hypothetical protein VK254_04615 [Candidatus Bathyarchaeia archaeon]|nr:hypothetical protein [Candidatus Bathyarchaeia archaeon]